MSRHTRITKRCSRCPVAGAERQQFCVEALEEAIAKYGRTEIFNTDQGSQFTSTEFTGVLKANGIRISMDGKEYWRSVKHEHVSLHAYESVSEAKQQMASDFLFYKTCGARIRRWAGTRRI